MVVWRTMADGSLGNATPCIFCARELERFDLRVHCVADCEGRPAWFSGRMSDADAPPCKLTTRQKMTVVPVEVGRGPISSVQQ